MRLNEGITAAKEELPDVAVLDVNVGGQLSYELADFLHERQIPIVFLTGYDSPAIGGKWRQHPMCRKPCDPRELRTLLIKALAGRKDIQG
jgi:CheY-like chemotaxis protein